MAAYLGIWHGKTHRQIKQEVMEHYSGVPAHCECCNETIIEFLTIDHINGDGAEFRKKYPGNKGIRLYKWLINNNYPPGLQVLCFNCNCAKSNRGICPHQI